jgi:hypothetical protein
MQGTFPVSDEAGHRAEIREIELTQLDRGVASPYPELRGDFLGAFPVAGGDDNNGASRSERRGRLDADPARAACNDHRLSGELDASQHFRCGRMEPERQLEHGRFLGSRQRLSRSTDRHSVILT